MLSIQNVSIWMRAFVVWHVNVSHDEVRILLIHTVTAEFNDIAKLNLG